MELSREAVAARSCMGFRILWNGPVVPEQPGEQGQSLTGQQDDSRPVERAGDAGQVHRDGVGFPVVRQHDGVVGGQVPGAGSALQFRNTEGGRGAGGASTPPPGRPSHRRGFHSHAPPSRRSPEGQWCSRWASIQGMVSAEGDAPLLHQGGHRGAPVLRHRETARGGHEEQQQIHHQKNHQLPEEKAESSGERPGRTWPRSEGPGTGGLESGCFRWGMAFPPFC